MIAPSSRVHHARDHAVPRAEQVMPGCESGAAAPGRSEHPAESEIDTIDAAYYIVAGGDWQTTTAPEASAHVGGRARSGGAAHPSYTRLNQILFEHSILRAME